MGVSTRVRSFFGAVALLARNITAHHTMLVASGVAFSCVLGLIPALIAVVAVYGLVAEPSDVESNLAPLVDVLPTDAGELLIDQLEAVTDISSAEVTLGLAIGLIGVLYAVSSALNAMVMAIRIAHEMPSPHTWLQGRIFALKLSVVAVSAAAAMIWLVVVLPEILANTNLAGALEWTLTIGRWPLVVLTSATGLAILYRVVLGHRPGGRRTISIGAFAGTVMWVLSTFGLSVVYSYIGRLDSTFGSLGAVAALMVWLYLSALSALVGAEVDGALHRHTVSPGW